MIVVVFYVLSVIGILFGILYIIGEIIGTFWFTVSLICIGLCIV